MSTQTTRTDERSDDPLLAVEGLQKYFDQSDGVLDRLAGDGSD